MAKAPLIVLAVLLLLPMALATNCTKASQSACGTNGTNGTGCQFYIWVNSSCQPPVSCQTSPTVTVWSNYSSNCVPCQQADSSLCANCANYSFYYNTNLGVCTTCKKQFSQQCLTCSPTQCLTCTAGYALTTDKQACKNTSCEVAYCETCLNVTTCQTCDGSHVESNGNCVCKISNCKQCGSGICYRCFDGYSVDSSKTSCKFNCIANCDSCTSLSSCSSCAAGYTYDSSVNRCKIDCTVIDLNCISCLSTIVCSGCAQKYKPSPSGTYCDGVCDDTNCESCSPSSNCTRCMTGYTQKLNNVSSLYTCSLDICQIPFCMVCNTSSTCGSCATFFKLNNDSTACIPSCGVTNCAYCISNVSCQTCINGYTTSSGSCVPICTISNCQLCASSSTCQICTDGFAVSADGQRCDYDCRITGCAFCNNATTCFQCGPGRSLNPAATRCNVDCQDGFFLNSTNIQCTACPTPKCRICDSFARCATCLDFYYLNLTDFSCNPCSIIPNCYNCAQGNAQCTECNTGFVLIDNGCVTQGACTVANCMICTTGTNSSCRICNDNYVVASGGASCKAITCPGNQISVGSNCVCGQKSYLGGGQCIACSDPNCLACTSTACTSCTFGFYPSGTSCLTCSDPNCKQCDSRGCNKCNHGFFTSSGACQQKLTSRAVAVSRQNKVINCPLGCGSCDLDNSGNLICLEANDGYILLNGKIIQCALPCITCAVFLSATGTASKCTSCPIGYALSQGSCLTCSDPFSITCLPSNRALSLACLPGYTTLNSTTKAYAGVCLPCADNCYKCDLTGSGSCDLGGCAPSTTQKSDGCLRCFNGCFKCTSNPNTCVQCSQFYYLTATATCLPCSSNCLTCNATACSNCKAGTFLFNSACVTPPSIPNCVGFDSTYTKCTACDFNFILNNATSRCDLSLTCNSTAKCDACPYGYFLFSGACLGCPAIASCSSCDMLNSSLCGDCVTGYYLDAGSCKSCGIAGCSACSSPLFCTTATAGYFLPQDITNSYTGQVQACAGNCATCVLSEINCLTCKEGSTLSGTECNSKNYQAATIVLYLKSLGKDTSVSADAETGQVYNFIFSYYGRLGKTLGFKTHKECQRKFRLKRIYKGSVSIDSTIDADATNVNIANAISNTQDSNFGLVSASVVSSSSQSDSSNPNLGLILGVSIPLGIILIIIIVLIKLSGNSEEGKKHIDETEKEVRDRDIEAL